MNTITLKQVYDTSRYKNLKRYTNRLTRDASKSSQSRKKRK